VIALEGLTKKYGATTALAPTTLHFEEGETTALIGPSGCGKSTLLRIIAGLVVPDAGRVVIDGRTLDPQNADAERRAMGYVIQDGGLFPHLTAEGNVTLVARWLGQDEAAIRARVDALTDMVRLPRALLTRYPRALSGGERQRVSLMRALMLDPKLLLLDEPMGALDPITRHDLQEELRGIFDRLKKTVVLVTHDLAEAAYLAQSIVVMKAGQVLQVGSFVELRDAPREAYVRDFVRAQRPPAREAT
jgi:osmoprotectant transport system ATP-binding protein